MSGVDELIRVVQSALSFEGATFLAQGGQKSVLKGTLSGQPAVAKVVLIPEGPSGIIARERAYREVELLSAVDSDHVVGVLTDVVEITEPTTALCWAEEYLGGVDLSATLSCRWTEDEVWKFLWDMANALEACHSLRVVHRDLSPGNIRKLENGQYVLMDPGLAKHLTKTALTGNFQPGTDGYRSPEHTPGASPLPASDIFSLGILAFYALTGTFPIDPSGVDYQNHLRESQAPSLATLDPTLDPELIRIIDRCLEKQPSRRFLDGNELLVELRGAKEFK